MSRSAAEQDAPPLAIGALLRFALDDVRRRIYEHVVAAGFTDVRPAHVTLFRWPGPHGMRPTELAAAVDISKQSINDRLSDLEQLGYLTRERDPLDSRARVIRLTKKGKKLHAAALAAHERIENDWARVVGEERIAELRAVLGALIGPRPTRGAPDANTRVRV